MTFTEAWPENIEEDVDRYIESGIRPDAEGFRIDTVAKAEWALSKIASRRRKVAEIKAFVDARVLQLADYLSYHVGQEIRLDTPLVELLEDYHRRQLDADSKAKTLRFPSGALVTRKQPDLWDVDTSEFVAWAQREAPAALRSKTEVDRDQIKRMFRVTDDGSAVTAAGEIVPGVRVERRGTGFKVTTTEVPGDDK